MIVLAAERRRADAVGDIVHPSASGDAKGWQSVAGWRETEEGRWPSYYVDLIPTRSKPKRVYWGIWETSCWHSEKEQEHLFGRVRERDTRDTRASTRTAQRSPCRSLPVGDRSLLAVVMTLHPVPAVADE